MSKFLFILLVGHIVLADSWKKIVIDTRRSYIVKDEGKAIKPLHMDYEETVNSELLINDNGDLIRMAYSSPFPSGDTLKIEFFDNGVSFAHSFRVLLLKDKYLATYSREIIGTDLFQTFEPIKTKLVLNSCDFSKGTKIRGYVQFVGECAAGCSDKIKKIHIEGTFAITINKY